MSKRKRPSTKTFRFQFTDASFKKRIEELLAQARLLAEKEAAGFRYEKVYVKPTRVKAHNRRGHHVMRLVKR